MDGAPRSRAAVDGQRLADRRRAMARAVCDDCGLARRLPVRDDLALYESGYALYAHAPGEAREQARQAAYAQWIASVATAAPARVLESDAATARFCERFDRTGRRPRFSVATRRPKRSRMGPQTVCGCGEGRPGPASRCRSRPRHQRQCDRAHTRSAALPARRGQGRSARTDS